MKLGPLKVNAAGGIHPSAPVFIDFSRSHFVRLPGDNGTNKSSTVGALLIALGEITGKKLIPYVNNESGTIDVDLPFTGNDRKDYHIRATKSTWKLTYEGDTRALDEPMTLLRKLVGPVGVNPLDIKNKPIAEIVKWLAAFSTKSPEEVEKRMQKIKEGIETAKTTRAAANKSAKAIVELMTDEGVMEGGEVVERVWKANEAKYTKQVDVKALSSRLDEAAAASDRYIKAEEKLRHQRTRRGQIEDQIKELQAELATVEKSISGGEKFLAENKGVKQEYDRVKEEYDNAAAQSVKYSQWQEMKKKKKELDEYQEIAQKADAKEKGLIQERIELQAELLPDIKGVELVMEDTHEEGGKLKKAGFYRDGVSSVQMSNGEWITTVIEMYRKNKVKIIVIDNAEQLGSDGMNILKGLSEKGCYVLVAEVARGKKELEIIYGDEPEEKPDYEAVGRAASKGKK